MFNKKQILRGKSANPCWLVVIVVIILLAVAAIWTGINVRIPAAEKLATAQTNRSIVVAYEIEHGIHGDRTFGHDVLLGRFLKLSEL